MTFHKKRHQRSWRLLGLGLMLVSGVSLMLLFLQDNLFYYYTPTDLINQPPSARSVRLGGLVKNGSIQRFPPTLDIHFVITDNTTEIPVRYHGVPPDLFAEGKGVVAEGVFDQGHFMAAQILAKHDENYSPPS